MNFIEEMRWRGLLHDMMPGIEEHLLEGSKTGYIGFDPTADSLHAGSLSTAMLLVHFSKCGHNPIALVGGATGMVGDPSDKADERSLLYEDELNKNIAGIHKQLNYLLEKAGGKGTFTMVNNYDWMKDFSFLNFIRDIGKHITVNYMTAKDSVKKRLETGLSFTEFSYQLLQGYDFLHLYQNYNCTLQMGGSDQWGNIVTGTELIRRKAEGKAYALTAPLVTKADGTKFGKTESGAVWLDAVKTSPYKFYQFWINQDDEMSEQYIKRFTLLSKTEIDALIEEHRAAPGARIVQKRLAEEVTTFVHNKEAYETAVAASNILFGKSTKDALLKLSKQDIQEVFEGVPTFQINKEELIGGIDIIDLLAEKTTITKSKGEARRSLKENAISVNKQKVGEDAKINEEDLLNQQHLIVQKGKKNYFLVEVV